jgi:hypothetical protein
MHVHEILESLFQLSVLFVSDFFVFLFACRLGLKQVLNSQPLVCLEDRTLNDPTKTKKRKTELYLIIIILLGCPLVDCSTDTRQVYKALQTHTHTHTETITLCIFMHRFNNNLAIKTLSIIRIRIEWGSGSSSPSSSSASIPAHR